MSSNCTIPAHQFCNKVCQYYTRVAETPSWETGIDYSPDRWEDAKWLMPNIRLAELVVWEP